MNEAEFYNNIYRATPGKWLSIERDYFAFCVLSGLVKEPGTMLDIGCGNGHTLAFFRSQWPDTRYAGVDISSVALELARKRVPEGTFYQELPPGFWDVITLMGVAEHFEDPAAELRKIGLHLEHGGYLYLEVPNCLAYSADRTEGFRQTHKGSGQAEWHWYRNTWKRAILAAGLEIVENFSGISPAWQYVWVLRRAG